jgi:hypothetical protein
MFRKATSGYGVAVCVHRVGHGVRPCNPAPETTTAPETLDELLDLVEGHEDFTMTFDDGYADSVAYVRDRAPRRPNVGWVVFVCPEKLTSRAGFRWDHYELLRRRNETSLAFDEFMRKDLDVDAENARPELLEVGRQPEFALASVEQCKRASELPNVMIGGHTNTHFNLCELSDADAMRELRRSMIAFEDAFKLPMEHFSFPFGTPGEHFADRHVEYLNQLCRPTMWSTHERPFARSENRSGNVLPRFAIPGGWNGKAMVLWISLKAVRERLRGARAEGGAPAAVTSPPPPVESGVLGEDDAPASGVAHRQVA